MHLRPRIDYMSVYSTVSDFSSIPAHLADVFIPEHICLGSTRDHEIFSLFAELVEELAPDFPAVIFVEVFVANNDMNAGDKGIVKLNRNEVSRFACSALDSRDMKTDQADAVSREEENTPVVLDTTQKDWRSTVSSQFTCAITSVHSYQTRDCFS